MTVPFRPCSIVALLTGSTQWLRLAVASWTLSFLCPRFPSNTDNPLSGTDTGDRVACKTLIGVLLGVLVSFKDCPCCFCRPTTLYMFSSTPVLGVFSSIWLVWRWGGLCSSVCVLIGASPARLRSTEGEGSFSAETIWQQALFVQIHLRIGTAHLTAQTHKHPNFKKGGNKTEMHFLRRVTTKYENKNKKQNS